MKNCLQCYETFSAPSIRTGPWLVVKFQDRFSTHDHSTWGHSPEIICSRFWCFDGLYHLQLPNRSVIHLSLDDYVFYKVFTCSTRFAKKHFPNFFPSGDAFIV